MRTLLYALCFLAVLGLAFWAYRENYATQASLSRVEALQEEIAELRESLAMQRAEWAYLNRPDRLRDLATSNFDRLGLLPLAPEQFGQPGEVAYPPPPPTFAPGSLEGVRTTDLMGSTDLDAAAIPPDAADTHQIVPTHEAQFP